MFKCKVLNLLHKKLDYHVLRWSEETSFATEPEPEPTPEEPTPEPDPEPEPEPVKPTCSHTYSTVYYTPTNVKHIKTDGVTVTTIQNSTTKEFEVKMSSANDIHEIDFTIKNTSDKNLSGLIVTVTSLQGDLEPDIDLMYKLESLSSYGYYEDGVAELTTNPYLKAGESRNYALTINGVSGLNKSKPLYNVQIHSLTSKGACTKCGAMPV